MKSKLFILLQYLLPQHFISRLAGHLANWYMPKWLLQPLLHWFVRRYGVDMSLAAEPNLSEYASFNGFFIRKLKPALRPIGLGITSPADGTVSELGNIENQRLFQAKNKYYTLSQLLANETALADNFSAGSFATIYLSPRDYHRVHMPYDGKLLQSIYVPGKLFSVNPITVQNIDGVFARNERLINIFQTDKGKMAVILVGAMLVAGMHTVWQGKVTPSAFRHIQTWKYDNTNTYFKKGDELGYFNFGSTVILLFEKDAIQWRHDIQALTQLNMGESLV